VIDEEAKTNRYAVEIPKALSFVLKHDVNAEIKGLNEFGNDYPPVAPVFWSFRIMVGIGVLMLLLAWYGTWATRRNTPSRSLLWCFSAFSFSGWIATLAGWMVTEIGRQPWLVTGILRTADAVGEASGASLGASLTAYVLTYSVLLLSYMIVVTHLAGKGAQ
jgi:cytochrome bd ubiquinol oxidase subunit I